MITDHAPRPSCLEDQAPTLRPRHVVSFGEATINICAAIEAERAECKAHGYETSEMLHTLERTAAETLIRLVRAEQRKEGR